jgi:uncharacterized protein with HEPN domain
MPSDSEATSRWLNDIQHHIAMAAGFVAGMSYESFKDDNLRLYAVIRCLEIISEASRRLPDVLTSSSASIYRSVQSTTETDDKSPTTRG